MMIDVLQETWPTWKHSANDGWDMFMSDLARSTVYNIADVADYYFANKKVRLPPVLYPCLAPKFEYSWFEYSMNKDSLGNLYDQSTDTRYSAINVGILIKFLDWRCLATVIVGLDRFVLDGVFFSCLWDLDPEDGSMPEDGEITVTHSRGHPLFSQDKNMAGDVSRLFVPPVMFSLSLLNCKNIATRLMPEKKRPKKKRPRSSRKLAEKLGNKSYRKHNVIVIKPFSSKAGGVSRFGGKSASAEHEVAGGFRSYGGTDPDGNPRGLLFGKLEGTWWWHPHMRGSSDRGKVTKQYKISMQGVNDERE